MKFPKSIYFILCYSFCEIFFLNGMAATLSLYFVDILMFSKSTAIVLYHTYKMLGFFSSFIGGIIADSWLGRYRTILYLNLTNIIGGLLLSISAIPMLNLPTREFTMIGLILISISTGGIRPCISNFGGEQFKMPEEKTLVSAFFAFYFFAVNLGALSSTFIIPILRKDITCFDKSTCYPLVHFISTISMTIALVVFTSGKPLYKINQPNNNVSLKFIKCVSHAIISKIKSKEKKKHWLDYAEDRYDKRTIKDIKIVFNVWRVLIPIPVFFALHDQLGSSWVFQGTYMKDEVFGYHIKPDQLQLANSLSLFILIPFFQFCVYPIIGKYLYINTQLKKMIMGGMVAGIAFIVSGIVEINLEPTYVVQPSNGLTQVRIFNTLDCNASILINDQTFILKGLDMYENISIPVKRNALLKFVAEFSNCHFIDNNSSLIISDDLNIQEKKATSWALTKRGLDLSYSDFIKKSKSGDPLVRALVYIDTDLTKYTLQLSSPKMNYSINLKNELNFTSFIEVDPNHYQVLINDVVIINNISIRYGGIYTIIGYISETTKVLRLVTVVNPNSIHMFWQLPQYILITIGEIMLQNVIGEFVFSQAPLDMKSIAYAGWLSTIAFGNLIVIVIAGSRLFERQVFEIFLYVILIFIDMFILTMLAKSYKFVEISSNESLNEILDEGTENNTEK